MAHVTVTIAGRAYRMACDDGQEEHLTRLGEEVDQRIDQLRGAFGEIGDQRLSIMSAITFADELSESRRQMRALQQELEAERTRLAAAVQRSERAERTVSEALTKAAERMESLTRELGTSPSTTVPMG